LTERERKKTKTCSYER